MYSAEQIQNLVSDPIENNEMLRKLSRQIYNSNGIVTNTIDYMTALPTLDKVIVTKGKSKAKGKANAELVQDVLSLIKDKEFIRDALFRGMLDGIAFYYCEMATSVNDNTKFLSDYDVDSISEINSLDFNMSIISLPTDFCRIRGLKNSSYVIAFDLRFFDEYGEKLENKLKKYPKEIRDGYYKYKESDSGSPWIILDNTKTIVFKIRSTRDEKWGRPLVLAAIADILYSDYFTDTKRNVLQEMNASIFFQTFPEGKEKGTSALTSKQQSEQHMAVKDAIINKNQRNAISFFSIAAGSKLEKLKVDNSDIFDGKNEENLQDKIATDLGMAASLLNGASSGNFSSQQNNLELISAELFMWIEQISSELNKVVNTNIIKDKNNSIEVIYLPVTNANKTDFVGYMKDLYTLSGGSRLMWIAATGVPVDAYMTLMEYEKSEKFDERFLPHPTSFTISDSADKGNPSDNVGGRPSEDNPINDSTIQSKTSNSNSQPKPSTK